MHYTETKPEFVLQRVCTTFIGRNHDQRNIKQFLFCSNEFPDEGSIYKLTYLLYN